MGLSANAEKSGTCGPNLKWHLTDDGVLTITGKGEMYDFSYSGPWGYPNLTKIIIGDGVTTIGKNAFNGCSSLYVTIGNSVTTIGELAFHDCRSLTYVTIPNSVTTIGKNAFDRCSSLTSVTLGNSVTTIGGYAFRDCSSLTSVAIGNSVTTIEELAFDGCSSLTSVTIPNSVTTIGYLAFRGCSSLTSVTIGNSVTTIGESAFYNCRSLTSVTIGNSVTTIGSSAFGGCSSLTSLTIPNSVTTIGGSAFRDCSSLTSVTIGNSVTTIGDNAFYNKSNTKVIWLTNTPPAGYRNVKGGIHYVANDLYTDLDNKRVYPYLSSIFEVDGIKYVPVSPSEHICDAIDCTYTGEPYELKINKKVNYKGVDMTVRKINPCTAYNCTKIKKAYIDIDGSIGYKAFSGCVNLSTVDITKVNDISDDAFSRCSNLTSVDIKKTNDIGNWTFSDCTNLTSVDINPTNNIGNNAFSGCTNLQKVYLGDSVKAIGEYAFNNCTSITQISSEAVVPPTCESGVFTDINKSKCKLIVPKNSLDAYKQAYQWEDFSLIEGSTTGITNTVYNKAGLADVYTIDGTKRLSKASTDEINALPKGVYIVNGKKIIIKNQ